MRKRIVDLVATPRPKCHDSPLPGNLDIEGRRAKRPPQGEPEWKIALRCARARDIAQIDDVAPAERLEEVAYRLLRARIVAAQEDRVRYGHELRVHHDLTVHSVQCL